MKTKLFFLLLIFQLTSCSRTDIAFQFFDTFAVAKVDDYFDLDRKQSNELQKNIERDLEKLRKELLPEVSKKLRQLSSMAEQDKIELDFVLEQSKEIQAYFRRISFYFKETAKQFVNSLKPAQFDYFAKEVREEIDDEKDERDQKESAFKRYRRSLEFWIGGLSSRQKEALEKFLAENPFPAKLQNESKEFVLQKFLAVRLSEENLKKFLEDYFDDYEMHRLPGFNQALLLHKKSFQAFLVFQLWPSLTKSQKSQLKENLLARAEELERVASRP